MTAQIGAIILSIWNLNVGPQKSTLPLIDHFSPLIDGFKGHVCALKKISMVYHFGKCTCNSPMLGQLYINI